MIEKDEKFTNIPSLADHHYHMLTGEINPSSSADAIEFIIARNLMKKDKPKCIKMIINSCGGEVASAFALIDTMKGSKIPIYTYGLGEISSSGLFIFMAGEIGNRYVTKNTSILSHQFSWATFGKEHELMAAVREYNNTSARIIEHYKKCTGQTEKIIKEYLLPAEDIWLSSKEAVKYGIADKVVDFY